MNRGTRWAGAGYRLNAPSGARCFLTSLTCEAEKVGECLNAPFGAGCFLTRKMCGQDIASGIVSMHLLVLGAF